MDRRLRLPLVLLATVVLLLAAAPPAAALIPGPTVMWTATVFQPDTPFSSQVFHDVARAADGSVFAVGQGTSTRGDADLLLVKLKPSGAIAWVRTYDTKAHWFEAGQHVVVSKAGQVVVAGSSWRGMGEFKGFVAAWTPKGKRLWLRQMKGTEGTLEFRDLAVDARGRAFVAGRAANGSRGDDLLLAAYSSAGRLLWKKLIGSGDDTSDQGSALALDSRGGVYVTGTLQRSLGDGDLAILKYDAAGRRKWKVVWDEGTASSESGRDIAVRGSVVAVAGYSGHAVGTTALVARYDTSGERRWVWVQPGPDRSLYYHVGIDRYAHILVGGEIDYKAGGNADFLAARYEPYGGPAIWTYAVNEGDPHYESVQDLAVGSEGQLYLVGLFGNLDATTDAVCIKLLASGAVDWMHRYSAGAEEEYTSIAIDGGGVVVAGHVAFAGIVQRLSLGAY